MYNQMVVKWVSFRAVLEGFVCEHCFSYKKIIFQWNIWIISNTTGSSDIAIYNS